MFIKLYVRKYILYNMRTFPGILWKQFSLAEEL